jgi:subtilisin
MRVINIHDEIIDYGVKLINPIKQWDISKGNNINIAVLDTGIDYNHEDLKDNVKGGINFTTTDANDYIDRAGHGTFCAGIIAAEENGQGIIGVAPNANLYAVKILNDQGQGTLTWLIHGIDWCLTHNIDIISMSLGFERDSEQMHAVICEAYKRGIIMVAAVGNNNTETEAEYPARYDEVIGVTAIDSAEHLASFDTVGSKVEISAPGVNITSTYPGNLYAIGSGTSFAVPHISGAIALIQAGALAKTGKKLSCDEVRKFIDSNVIDLGTPGRDVNFGFGLFKF